MSACWQLPEHRLFICFEKGSTCSQDALLLLEKTIREVGFDIQRNIAESQKAVEASKVFLEEMASPTLTRRPDRWTVPSVSVSMQTVPVHIINFFAKAYKDVTLLLRCQHTPLLQ